MNAAEKLIRYANTDDSLRSKITVVDGVDLTTVTEIVSDEYIDGHHYDPLLSGPGGGERRKIVCRTADGQTHTFFWAAEGSPDGVWSHMSTDRKHEWFHGAF